MWVDTRGEDASEVKDVCMSSVHKTFVDTDNLH
jgi:hypothetical protein